MSDLDGRETAAAVALIVMMLWMGAYSKTFLPRISLSTARVLEPIELRVEQRQQLTRADAR